METKTEKDFKEDGMTHRAKYDLEIKKNDNEKHWLLIQPIGCHWQP